jgi:hypothetical protein
VPSEILLFPIYKLPLLSIVQLPIIPLVAVIVPVIFTLLAYKVPFFKTPNLLSTVIHQPLVSVLPPITALPSVPVEHKYKLLDVPIPLPVLKELLSAVQPAIDTPVSEAEKIGVDWLPITTFNLLAVKSPVILAVYVIFN